jgi:AAA family ATP:ADP antiporter
VKTSPEPIRRVLGLCGRAYALMVSYALARPATESLFLESWSSESLPKVWIAVALTAVVVVSIYNRFAATVGLIRLYGAVAAIASAVLAALLVARPAAPAALTFALYVWKDVYIVVLVEIFWSYANSSFQLKAARWIYGLFCVMGSLGGITGNLLVGELAGRFGTGQVLWGVIPLLGLSWAAGALLAPAPSDPGAPVGRGHATSLGEGMRVLRESPYLGWMLALIATVQVVITLVDYSYNAAVEVAYPDTDARTAVIGQVYAAIDTSSLVLQLATGPVLRVLGISLTLLAIPGLLAGAVGGYLLVPRFLSMAIAKVASKSLDYSLFRAAKELLYLPLSYAEKTQGKAFVDIMTYRVAKGGASLLLMGLVALGSVSLVTALCLAGIVIWIGLTAMIVRRYRALEGSEDEAA